MVASQADMNMKREDREKLRDNWMKNLIVNFGDDEGNEVTFNGTVVQALMLMNGKEINNAVSNKEKGTMANALRMKTLATRIRYLYLAALNRPPTPLELQSVNKEIKLIEMGRVKDKNPDALYQDIFW